MAMNKRVKKKWVKALETGRLPDGREATQTNGRLHVVEDNHRLGYKTGFCCLGVLCEIAVAEGVIPAPVDEDYLSEYGKDASERETATTPYSVWEWAGLEADDPDVQYTANGMTKTRTLSTLNDNGHSFNEIAALIREQL